MKISTSFVVVFAIVTIYNIYIIVDIFMIFNNNCLGLYKTVLKHY